MTAVGSEDGRKLEKQSGFPINFSLSHLLADGFIIGTALFRMSEKKAKWTPAWKFSGRLSHLALLCIPFLKGLSSMVAVSHEVWEILTVKHSGIQHSVFLASYRYEGRNTESCQLMGNPHKSVSECTDRWWTFVRPFRHTLASWAWRPSFSQFILISIHFPFSCIMLLIVRIIDCNPTREPSPLFPFAR